MDDFRLLLEIKDQDANTHIFQNLFEFNFYSDKNNRCLFQELLKKWNNIPTDTDILMTHTPPLGFGDTLKNGKHVRDVDLLLTARTPLHLDV